jgi:hypothetical protein
MIKLDNIYFNAPELEEVFCRNYKPNLTNGNTKIYSFKNDKLLHKLFKNTNIDEELMEIPQNDINIKMKKIRNNREPLSSLDQRDKESKIINETLKSIELKKCLSKDNRIFNSFKTKNINSVISIIKDFY